MKRIAGIVLFVTISLSSFCQNTGKLECDVFFGPGYYFGRFPEDISNGEVIWGNFHNYQYDIGNVIYYKFSKLHIGWFSIYNKYYITSNYNMKTTLFGPALQLILNSREKHSLSCNAGFGDFHIYKNSGAKSLITIFFYGGIKQSFKITKEINGFIQPKFSYHYVNDYSYKFDFSLNLGVTLK